MVTVSEKSPIRQKIKTKQPSIPSRTSHHVNSCFFGAAVFVRGGDGVKRKEEPMAQNQHMA